jgi:hypothetical protein
MTALPINQIIQGNCLEEYKQGPFIFTTLRRYTPAKLAYYKGLVGETFDCVRIEEKKEAHP